MKIKEKVLKHFEAKINEYDDDEIEEAIDLTLAEVMKVIDEEIEVQEMIGKEERQHKRSIDLRIIGLKLVKQELGIK